MCTVTMWKCSNKLCFIGEKYINNSTGKRFDFPGHEQLNKTFLPAAKKSILTHLDYNRSIVLRPITLKRICKMVGITPANAIGECSFWPSNAKMGWHLGGG